MPTKTPRRRDRICSNPNVRETRGRYQARVWIGGLWGSINLGLYASEPAAAAASRAVLRSLEVDTVMDPLTMWAAAKKAMRAGVVRDDVLPKFVFRRGDLFFARFLRTDRPAGPFRSPVEACLWAVDQRLQQLNAARSAADARAI